MRAKNVRMSLILACVGLCLLGLPLRAQQQTGSVLSRVQTVEDLELGDLIRAAIENYEQRSRLNPVQVVPQQELELVQGVTESYARIKLLDEQIEQTTRRAKAGGAADVVGEMVLAKAELESKRMIELGKLRQIMGVIPAHAFGRRPTDELKTWLHLDVVGDRVVVSTSLPRGPYSLSGIMAKNAVVEYVAKQMKGENRLPIRIDIHRTVDGVPLSEQLESEIIQLVKKSNVQLQAEVHLEEVHQAFHNRELFVKSGKVGTRLREPPDQRSYVDGIIEPNDLAHTVESWIVGPEGVPAVFTIAYFRGDEEMADKVSQTVMETAKRVGLSEFVQVKRILRQPKPEYAGSWEAKRPDDTWMKIDVRPNGICQRSTRGEQAMGRWSLRDQTLIFNFPDVTLEGNLDSQGHLVIATGNETMIFTKVR